VLKRISTLSLIIIITFVGGFFTGKFSTTNQAPLSASEPPIINEEQDITETKVKPEDTEIEDNTKTLMAYVQDFRNPEEIAYDELTHVIFSFAHPTADGNIMLNGDTALTNLRTIVTKAKETDTKVILAVGGWSHLHGGESYDYFKAAISDPISRNTLVSSLMSIVEQEGLDGIDIDFEHPRSLLDAKNLTDFTKELSDQLHPQGKELSIAVHSKINAYTLTETDYVIYEPSTFEYVDHVNIMAYDGQWDEGYHAENMSSYLFTEKIANYWSNLFEQNKLEKEKLILGVPFYAQPEDASINPVSYATIIHNNPANAMNDTVSLNGTIYHYNGSETMKKKTNLALEEGFGGMMLWEAGHDAAGPHSLISIIYKELNINS